MAAAPPQSMPNLYVHKIATTDSPCFVCSKFCAGVLTNNAGDWFYVCKSHIDDPSFCKQIPASSPNPSQSATPRTSRPVTPTPPPPAAEEQLSQGWLSTIAQTLNLSTGEQQQPQEKEKNANCHPQQQPEEKKLGLYPDPGPAPSAATPRPQQLHPPVQALAPPGPTKYVLSPNIFYLREAQQRKRVQQRAANSLSQQLPSVPKGMQL
ncbi:VPS4-associated protein 1 [Powellomyces hirtus]|nr:VPS4-associated protein 1 [Powellomyces hirtus]